jgi:hypothetical protein
VQSRIAKWIAHCRKRSQENQLMPMLRSVSFNIALIHHMIHLSVTANDLSESKQLAEQAAVWCVTSRNMWSTFVDSFHFHSTWLTSSNHGQGCFRRSKHWSTFVLCMWAHIEMIHQSWKRPIKHCNIAPAFLGGTLNYVSPDRSNPME